MGRPSRVRGERFEERPEATCELVVAHSLEPLRSDRGDDGEDAAHQVGAAGGGVLVGGLEQGPEAEVDALVTAEAVAVARP